ncbi:aminoglycoside phosphotransferase family protein [Sulfurirhabdus autotrophica]|uniref:aminoglycoside phosphotransferase family protein n=1 Tax=Sulfurirhabdus autotrophica TaxID=1706046 RepID=UPI00351F79E3
MIRTKMRQEWLQKQFPSATARLEVASADASFRHYFRATVAEKTYILMDAPPSHEDCKPFIAVSKLFGETGVHVPEVLAQDLEQGFLLLTDLGNATYLSVLNDENADDLYGDAIDALIQIQKGSRPNVLPEYDATLLTREMNLLPEWYISKHLQHVLSDEENAVLNTVFESVLSNNLVQGKVFVHRDYHSRNLMVSKPNPGILDFQDAVYGPITYDLVSLFKDAYIQWEEAQVLDWVIRYWEKARKAGLPVQQDFAEFYRDFEWMGVQRHIKVLGIFARLFHRDGKDGYIKDMPLVADYLRKACTRYRELVPLIRLLDKLEGASETSVGYSF